MQGPTTSSSAVVRQVHRETQALSLSDMTSAPFFVLCVLIGAVPVLFSPLTIEAVMIKQYGYQTATPLRGLGVKPTL